MEIRKNKLKKWLAVGVSWLVIVSFLIPTLPASATQPTQAQINTGISKAINYLISQQAKDGSIDGSMGKPSTSAWSAMAFAAAGINPQTIKKIKGIPVRQQRSLMDYLKGYTKTSLANPDQSIKVTDYARQILAAYTVEPYPHAFGGVNLLKHLVSYYDEGTKQFIDPKDGAVYVNDDIWAIIAYSSAWPLAAESYKYINSVKFLIDEQNGDGGFSFDTANAWGSDVDDTAAALQALILAKKAGVQIDGLDNAINNAYEYLKDNQNADGGFGYFGSSNPSSTAWAVQAIVANKGKADLANFVKNENDSISYLLSQQKNDGSFVDYNGNSDPWITSQVISALAKTPWPIRWNTNFGLLSTQIVIRGSRKIVGVGKYLNISGTISPPRSGYVYLRYKRGRSKWHTLRKIKVNGPNFNTKVKIGTANHYAFAASYGTNTSRQIVVYGKRRR